jgi:hypothetical protein
MSSILDRDTFNCFVRETHAELAGAARGLGLLRLAGGGARPCARLFEHGFAARSAVDFASLRGGRSRLCATDCCDETGARPRLGARFGGRAKARHHHAAGSGLPCARLQQQII